MNTKVAKNASGRILQRGDVVVSVQTARNLTFAYVTDDGRVATQESGYLPVIHHVNRLHGISVTERKEA